MNEYVKLDGVVRMGTRGLGVEDGGSVKNGLKFGDRDTMSEYRMK